jgi:hypothetical protein
MAHVDAASKLIRLALLNGTNSAEYVSERSNLVQVLAAYLTKVRLKTTHQVQTALILPHWHAIVAITFDADRFISADPSIGIGRHLLAVSVISCLKAPFHGLCFMGFVA